MHLIDIAYAQETTATEQPTQDQGLLASLGINGSLFLFQLINFAIVASIIWFLILKPLTKKMSERQKIIDESIDNAKRVQDNLQKSEQRYQERVDEAKVEANKIIERATHDAITVNEGVKEKAKKEIETLIDQAKRNIRIEREEMKTEIRKESASMIIAALEKVLSEKMTDEKDKKMIEEMVNKLR